MHSRSILPRTGYIFLDQITAFFMQLVLFWIDIVTLGNAISACRLSLSVRL